MIRCSSVANFQRTAVITIMCHLPMEGYLQRIYSLTCLLLSWLPPAELDHVLLLMLSILPHRCHPFVLFFPLPLKGKKNCSKKLLRFIRHEHYVRLFSKGLVWQRLPCPEVTVNFSHSKSQGTKPIKWTQYLLYKDQGMWISF